MLKNMDKCLLAKVIQFAVMQNRENQQIQGIQNIQNRCHFDLNEQKIDCYLLVFSLSVGLVFKIGFVSMVKV